MDGTGVTESSWSDSGQIAGSGDGEEDAGDDGRSGDGSGEGEGGGKSTGSGSGSSGGSSAGNTAPDVENASTVLTLAGFGSTAIGEGKLGSNFSLYRPTFYGNQYVSILADLGRISKTTGLLGGVASFGLDLYGRQWIKATVDEGIVGVALRFPQTGAFLGTAWGGWSIGTWLSNRQLGNGMTVGDQEANWMYMAAPGFWNSFYGD